MSKNSVKGLVDGAKPVNDAGKIDKWANNRIGDFTIEDGRVWFMRKGRDSKKNNDDGTTQINEIPTPLTDNFIALVKEQIILDDGLKKEAAFLIEGMSRNFWKERQDQKEKENTTQSDAGDLPTLTIPAVQYQTMSWPLKHWGALAIVEADQATPRRLANAILKLSGHIPITTVYQHIGWRKIKNEWHYLTNGGGIHAGGYDESIQIELGDGHINKYQLPPPHHNQHQNGRGFLELMTLSTKNPRIGPVLFAAVARAVLGEVLPIDFSLYIAGRSGAQKSEAAAILLGFFGSFDARSFPANFTDTETDLEPKAHQAKDAVFVVDDFAPGVTQHDANRLHAKAERLFRSAGNQAGRGRRNSDMTAKPAYYPRGLVVATAEDLPRGASLLGRLLILEIQRGDIDLNVLTVMQSFSRDGRLRAAMAGFIQWLAPRINELKKSFPLKVRDLRDKHLNSFVGAHSRAPDLFASLFSGADLLIDYLLDIEVISEVRALDFAENLEQNLMATMMLQGQFQKQTDEVERFILLLQGCFSTGDVHVGDHLTNGPPKIKPFVFGWRASIEGGDLSGCGGLIGWIDEAKQELLLEPEPTFKAIQRFGNSQNEPMLINKATLWRRLQERGFLLALEQDAKTGATRTAVKRHIRCTGRSASARVLVMDAKLIINREDD